MPNLTPNLSLTPLQSTQLEAKLRHCAKRLRSLAYDIACRAPPRVQARSIEQCRAEVRDCIRYLEEIAADFPGKPDLT